MAWVWYRFRGGFGRRWRSYASSALVLGLIGGVALAALSGARRTASAHSRFLRGANSSTVSLSSGGAVDPQTAQAVKALPQVKASASYVAFDCTLFRPDGQLDLAFLIGASECVGSLDGRYFTQDRFTVLHGRMADPARADEVVVDELSARMLGVRVGDRRDLGTWDDKDVQSPGFSDHPTDPKDRLAVTIVGIGLFNDEVIQDDQDRLARVLMTPAFSHRNLSWATYAWQGVILKGGDRDADAVRHSFQSLLPPGSPLFSRVTSVDAAHAQRSIRPQAVALGIFGGIAFLASLLLAGQALGRLIAFDGQDLASLRSMGASPRAAAAAPLPGAAVTILAGTTLAFLIAAALSPLSPIGPVRRVEAAPGFFLDWAALGAGSVALVVVLGTAAAVMSWRQTPHRVRARAGRASLRASIAVVAAGSVGLPAPAVTGIHMALGGSGSGESSRARAALFGPAIPVIALVAALCFAQSLKSLVDHPRLYGWNWDAALVDQGGYGNIKVDQAHTILDHDPAVAAWSGVYFGIDAVGGIPTPMLGIEPGGSILPPILSGRSVASATEIVLGPVTLATVHRRVGDYVTVGEGPQQRAVRIVGTAAFPAIGAAHSLHTSLGTGALVVPDLVPGASASVTGSSPGPNAALLRFRPGVDPVAERARLKPIVDSLANIGYLDVLGVQRPAELVNYVAQGTAPALLAGGLGGAALISLALTLGSSVRRRRRDLALLKALGFTRGQISATVAWQATVTVLLGVVFGVPLGIALGRWLWILFARKLAFVPAPVIPWLPICASVVGIVALANVAAAIPALAAARTPTNRVLRDDLPS